MSAGSVIQPKSSVELQEQKLGKFWTALSQALYTTFDQALSSRERRDLKLDAWNAAYEMRVPKRNWPWPNAPLSRDTEVLTASGWQRVDSLCIGDTVLTRRDEDGALEWAPVEATPRVYAETLLRFRSKSVDQLVTHEHQMVVQSRINGRTKRLSAREVATAQSEWSIPLTGNYRGYNPRRLFGLPARDVMELVGWFVAEGSTNRRPDGEGSGTVFIAQSRSGNQENCERLEALMQRLEIRYSYSGGSYALSVRTMPEELASLFHRTRVSYEKSLPEWVFGLSPTLLECLLSGLVGGDGHVRKRDGRPDYVAYLSTSKMLADQVQLLALLTGKRARINVRVPGPGGTILGRTIVAQREIYEVSFGVKQYAQLRRMQIKEVPYNDYAFCVTVKNHAIYVRRNGVASFTGNSNVSTTIIPTQLDTTLANIVLGVYAIQRFYVVNGNTEQAANTQHDVEQFLNAELFRQRPGRSWLFQHIEALFAGLRDGNGITEILYRKEWATQNIAVVQRVQDPDTGMDVMDPMTNQPIIRTTVEEHKVPIYDDVDLQTVELRDFGVIPSWQTDIDKAAGVWRRSYMDSNALLAMCKSADNPDGPLRKEAVEYAINFNAKGEDELRYSRQGYSTYSIVGDIDVGLGEGTAQPELQQHVGPMDIVRIHTNAFFNGKEYVFWLHPLSETVLGWQRYQYWHGQRPFSVKTPFPRVKRFYGLSLVERLLPSVVEIQGNRNRRNDFLDQRTLPPMYEVDGAKLLTKNNALGPDARWKVNNPNDVGILPLPQQIDTLMAGREEEELMNEQIQEFTGNSSPMLGAPASGRPTAKGIQAAVARASVRHNFIAMHVRDADMRTIEQIRALKIQYGPDVAQVDTNIAGIPKRLVVPKDVLAQDYTVTIAGSGGPLDKATRTQEMQSLYALLMQNPLVAGNQVRIWGVTRMLLEEYSRADILALIGTRDEAEQQAKLTQMMQQAGIAPGAQGAAGGAGAPAAPPEGGQ